jgi:hypothetical protein
MQAMEGPGVEALARQIRSQIGLSSDINLDHHQRVTLLIEDIKAGEPNLPLLKGNKKLENRLKHEIADYETTPPRLAAALSGLAEILAGAGH